MPRWQPLVPCEARPGCVSLIEPGQGICRYCKAADRERREKAFSRPQSPERLWTLLGSSLPSDGPHAAPRAR